MKENKKVYLDNNATTPVSPIVLEKMIPFLTDSFGNPSSIHAFGRESRRALDEARGLVAEIIGAQDREIVFTAGGSEADNFAIKGTFFKRRDKGRHVITTAVEHPAVLETCRYLEKQGAEVTYLAVNGDGLLDPDELERSIRSDTILISVMMANNETGVIFPIKEIGRIARERGVTFHCDAVQALGKLPINVQELNVDLLSVSGHKINAPKGVGALYVRRSIPLSSIIHGGHQERGRRAGTENIPGIAGFGEACRLARQRLAEEAPRLGALRDRLEGRLLERVDDVRVNGHKQQRLYNTTNMSFRYIEGESILLHLDALGIAASSGSACTSGSLDPSHVLIAMGVAYEDAHASVRFSLGAENTEEDIDFVVSNLPPIVEKLRAMSPIIGRSGTTRPPVEGHSNQR